MLLFIAYISSQHFVETRVFKMPPKISDEKIRILTQVVQANKIELNGQICTNWEKVISNFYSQLLLFSIMNFWHVFISRLQKNTVQNLVKLWARNKSEIVMLIELWSMQLKLKVLVKAQIIKMLLSKSIEYQEIHGAFQFGRIFYALFVQNVISSKRTKKLSSNMLLNSIQEHQK